MDNKEYVAELLKELEKLKKKKALKERKLQKLKKCSIEDLKRERAIHTSNKKIPDQKNNTQTSQNEHTTSVLNSEKSVSEKISSEKESCHSVIDFQSVKCDNAHLMTDKLTQKNNTQTSKSKYNINGLSLEKSVSEKIPSQKESCDSVINLESLKCDNSHLKIGEGNCVSKETDNAHLKTDEGNSVSKEIDLFSFDNHEFKDIEIHSDVQRYFEGVHNEKCPKNPSNGINKTTLNDFQKLSPVHNDFLKNDTNKISDIVFTKPNIIEAEKQSENCVPKKVESSLSDDYKLKCNVKELHPDTEMLNNENAVHDLCLDVKEVNESESLPVDIDVNSEPVPIVINDLKINSSPESENKSPHVSIKSLPTSKSSDILDDSLNSNMSFFMSADLFAADYGEKKTINTHNDCTVVKNIVCPVQTEKISKLTDFNPKIPSPKNSDFAVNGSQHSFIFNFPKFSTPTAQKMYEPENDENVDIIGNSQPKISTPIKDKSYSAKAINALNETLKNNVSVENKVDSPKLNFVLEKRLSSVLDAHYDSPKKPTPNNKIASVITYDNQNYYSKEIKTETVCKKRKLFSETHSDTYLMPKSKLEITGKIISVDPCTKSGVLCKSEGDLPEADQQIIGDNLDFNNMATFDSSSNSFRDLKNISDPGVITLAHNSCDDVQSQVSKTVDGLVAKVCEDGKSTVVIEETIDVKANINDNVKEDLKVDSEVLVIPETEGLGLYFSKDDEDFLETSTLSQSLKDFRSNENFLNMSSQSKLESPVVNNIVAAVKSSRTLKTIPDNEIKQNIEKESENNDLLKKVPKKEEKIAKKMPNDAAIAFDNSLGLDTSFLEDDTQELGNFKQVPYMNEINAQENITVDECRTKSKSNLNFTCSLFGTANEPVLDVEIVLFSNVKYVFIQHKTHIHVWRQEKNKQWVKTFSHQIEDMLSLEKICVSMDEDNLVIVMLLSNDEQYCLQFLLFEKDARVIKLMENTHWLEERHSKDSILLCGLNGLMFATAQNKENSEVSLHAFISLKENPRLMTAVLGSTDTPLCSLCKIDKLPNALMGINDSMLYVWHILEARLVTAVSLHPHDYHPIKQCFWATVENGLIYFLTTCENDDSNQVCQLLAANLATGFCQSALVYSTQPSNYKINKIIKAVYLEPFLVVAHSDGAFIWSITEEFCCAALSSKSHATTIAISRDFNNWGILVIGSKSGCINCYSLN